MTNACWTPLASWASLSPRLDEAGVEQTAGGTQKGTQSPRQKKYTGGTQWTASQSQNEPLNSQERPPPVPGRQGVGGSNPRCSTPKSISRARCTAGFLMSI